MTQEGKLLKALRGEQEIYNPTKFEPLPLNSRPVVWMEVYPTQSWCATNTNAFPFLGA